MTFTLKPQVPDHTTPMRPERPSTALPILRDQFSLTTLLLVGASIQCLLFALPVRPLYKFGPPLLLLLLRIGSTMLQLAGIISNPYMNGVVLGRHAAVFPTADGSWTDERQTPGGSKICVLLLGARSNSPLGAFDPRFRQLNKYAQTMFDDLDAGAATNGFLGRKTYLAATDRETSNEFNTIFYFRSMEHLQAWAHGDAHRAGWDWWMRDYKSLGHITIFHEAYEAPAGSWETIYVNTAPTLMGSTAHPLQGKDGELKWQKPLVDARFGAFRSNKGRRGVSRGEDNDVYDTHGAYA